MLVGAEEPQRLNQMEILLSTGHGDIKQTALFLDLRRIAGGHVRGDAAIDEMQHIDRVPFLTLWQNGSSTGSDNPRRARGGRLRRRSGRAGRASLRRESVRGLGSPWRSVRAGRG